MLSSKTGLARPRLSINLNPIRTMKYISPRTQTVSSLSGRSVEFIKGEPTDCPPQMHAELIAKGIVPADPIDEPDETKTGPQEPVLPHEREAALFKVYETMTLRAKREDFTAQGAPHLAVLAKELGWTNAVAAKERDATWSTWTLKRLEETEK
jgi:hypothetical protein